jgi:hypothetical protein
MERYNRWNNMTGWGIFFIAALVYLLTMEPTASFWDCGEFISCAYKLEVGHPPGAPLFLMMANIFSHLAPNLSKVAVMVNTMSALASAFTIMFLFWTITRLARKIVPLNDGLTTGKIITIIGAGAVGALAFTFSDTFWFSAVEGEVYATSSLFTAIVFWAILKWEAVANEPYANRWIILIAYLMGLSIGVHLLNLLAIPAIVLVFYFKKYRPTFPGFVLAVIISFFILAGVQYGIIPGIVKLAAVFELWFVNSLGFAYNSGIITYSFLLIFILIGGLWLTFKTQKTTANTILLAITMILAGYGSYAMIIIRSHTNPPVNENKPDNIFSLLSYLNREQYGDNPLLYGPYYNAPTLALVDGEPTYTKEKGKYIIVDRSQHYTFDSRFKTFFPRMYGRNQNQIGIYKEWADIKGKPMTVDKDGKQVVEYCPTFGENLSFFFKYQLGYMYLRYFMWNFSGRQNEVDGDCGILHGNWITGFNVIDSKFLGPQDKLPNYLKENKGRNRYFMLPLLLGLLGLVYQFGKNKQGFALVFFLFFMTGIAIVIYLNQTPLQPRERDYAYAGSFYSFAIWIGIGTLALAELFKKWFSCTRASIIATVLSLIAVPTLMASQNWNDHDRSGRYTARDIAYNYLNSCAPDAILFTDGDNDTFPLWYLQEVEGVRTDVRVINTVLLSSDWYIDQLKQKVYDSAPVPISLTNDKYLSRRRNYVYLIPRNSNYLPLKDAVSFASSDDPDKKTIPDLDFTLDYIPTKKFMLSVDSANVIDSGTVKPEHASQIIREIPFIIDRGYISRSELMVMDILSQNNWKRPIYFVWPNSEATLGLNEYLQLDGFAYRLVPISTKKTERFSFGRIETSVLYDHLMNKFRWGRMNKPDVFIDSYNINTLAVLKVRVSFARLAEQLFMEGKKDSAVKVISRCYELMPLKIFPPDIYSIKLIETAYKIGATSQARQLLNEYTNMCLEEVRFFYAMPIQQFMITQTENIIAQQTIQQLAGIAKQNGDIQIQKRIEKELKVATDVHKD